MVAQTARKKYGPYSRTWRTPVLLGVDRETYRRMRERAAAEGLAFAAWLRRLALRELRKPTL